MGLGTKLSNKWKEIRGFPQFGEKVNFLARVGPLPCPLIPAIFKTRG
jgi:hypothetical protein